jgi:hypothetical protein
MIIDESDYLKHYGILRRSGRYPWGSGGPENAGSTQAKKNKSFLDHVANLRAQGMTDTDIAKGMGSTTTDFRAANSIARNAQRQADIAMAQRLKDKGLSNVAIGKRMGGSGSPLNESSVRSLLAPGAKDRADVLKTTSDMLRDQVTKKKFVQIGSGVENELGLSKDKLATAVAILKEEGYKVHTVQVDQLGTGGNKKTAIKVLTPPGTTYPDVAGHKDQIKLITDYTEDQGRSWNSVKPPLSISSRRVAVKYAEDGGADADGVIYVRPGKTDLSLGQSHYAQVRIAVDGTHYLKGMAMYKDDLPPGVDLVFNTSKSSTGRKRDAFKEMKKDKDGNIDPENPFGSSIRRQILNKDGSKPSSVMNIVNEEGNWETWSKSLSSQILSKQSPTLAKTQLNMTYEQHKTQLDTILSLTNPTVRDKLLRTFADGADSSAEHLAAAHLPRQRQHVILPISSLKENEVYAPKYNNGERVVLLRHPHGGTFEIPELVVNNSNREARKILGHDPPDAIGIHPKVAKKLSGADFDGDSVIVIPNSRNNIKTTPSLLGLKNFDPQREYPAYEGMPKMTARMKGREMGDVSNLITDMTIQGANNAELARAVRHSMVVIDAEKHHLNYKLSAEVNGIKDLKQRYQGDSRAGASTLISRAGARKDVPERKERSARQGGPIDPRTGKKVYVPTGETFTRTTVSKRTGQAKEHVVVKKTTTTKLADTHDAHSLVSRNGGTLIEKIYADHSNRLKALANEARKAAVSTKPAPYSPSAKKHYAKQVTTLNAKLNVALKNSPLERQAQLIANTVLSAKKQAHPEMSPDDIKKVKFQALQQARFRVGAGKEKIDITDDEWSAIQAGAISPSKLAQILNHADIEQVKKLATPRVNTVMTSAKQKRAEQMLASGYTQAEVAAHLGVALSTLNSSILREEG